MIYQFNDTYIGVNNPNSITEWMGSDTEINFKKNLLCMPNDWYYKNNKVTYNINELGHRSISKKELNFNNYILFTGCSHTFGVGLDLELTYPYLLSKKLGMNFYNLALGGSGLDVLFYNLQNWLTNNIKPKIIVIQWPDEYRFLGTSKGNLVPIGSWHFKVDEYEDFYTNALNIKYFDLKFLLHKKQILNQCGSIPILHLNFHKFIRKNLPDKILEVSNYYKDLARDNIHYGKETNYLVSENLYKIYKDNF